MIVQALVLLLHLALFSFEGADQAPPFGKAKFAKAFFVYFLSRKKVCAFSSVGRATDS